MLTQQQQSDFDWFVSEMPRIYKEYGACYALIKDQQVVGVYPGFAAGVEAAERDYDPGTFIVQEVGPDESAYTVEMPAMWVTA